MKRTVCPVINKDGSKCKGRPSDISGVCGPHSKDVSNWVNKPKKILSDVVAPVGNSIVVSKKLPAHVEEVTVERYTCDECGRWFYLDNDIGEVPLGFHGTVFLHHPTGGDGCDFFVCWEHCGWEKLSDGIDKALSRDR